VNRLLLTLSLCAACSLLAGCTNPPYAVTPLFEETRRGKLDAEWFTREISDGSGLQAVELTYCPIEPNQSVVCRTAIVWRRNQSALIDVEPNPAATAPVPR
jgi:hypothetical protein